MANIIGTSGNDQLYATDGNDYIDGKAGFDVLHLGENRGVNLYLNKRLDEETGLFNMFGEIEVAWGSYDQFTNIEKLNLTQSDSFNLYVDNEVLNIGNTDLNVELAENVGFDFNLVNFNEGVVVNQNKLGYTNIEVSNVAQIHGSQFDDKIAGNDADNWIEGVTGNDYLYGGAGDDHIFSNYEVEDNFDESQFDILEGGAGNDVIIAKGGHNKIIIGEGTDIIDFENATAEFYFRADKAANSDLGDLSETLIKIGSGFIFAPPGQETGLVDIRDYQGQPFIFKNYELADSEGRGHLFDESLEFTILFHYVDGFLSIDIYYVNGEHASASMRIDNVEDLGLKFYAIEQDPFSDDLHGDSSSIVREVAENGKLYDFADRSVFETVVVDTATDGDDSIWLTDANENINAKGGDDVVYAMEGNDRIYGGAGRDRLNGGDGDDTLDGGEGDDILMGWYGDDLLKDNSGQNILDGFGGNDTYVIQKGEYQNHIVDPFNNANELDKMVFVDGLTKDDFTFERSGDDLLIVSKDGQITLRVYKQYVDDFIGIEKFIFADGEVIDGSEFKHQNTAPIALDNQGVNVNKNGQKIISPNYLLKNDTDKDGDVLSISKVFSAKNGKVSLDENGNIKFVAKKNFEGFASFKYEVSDGNGGFDVATMSLNVMKASIKTTSKTDISYGTNSNDFINGLSGHDDIYGKDGADRIFGGAGHDSLYGGDGYDKLYGGDGVDTLYGGNGSDLLKGGANFDDLYGGTGNDLIYGENGHDSLYGGADHDRLYGGSGDDSLYGGGGNDRLYGQNGIDMLFGNHGNDKLFAGGNDDDLYGGSGDDILHGGSGYDRFFFKGNFGKDIILDFKTEIDNIFISGHKSLDFDSMILKSKQIEDDVVIDLGQGNQIQLNDVLLKDLNEWDFNF